MERNETEMHELVAAEASKNASAAMSEIVGVVEASEPDMFAAPLSSSDNTADATQVMMKALAAIGPQARIFAVEVFIEECTYWKKISPSPFENSTFISAAC